MVYNVLDKLPHYAKQAFNMYYIEGLKHDEIAEKLNITASTSKTNLMKAKIKIRTLLNV
jgi:RNA polymerase sigma-70 factor (ECF subfamily)